MVKVRKRKIYNLHDRKRKINAISKAPSVVYRYSIQLGHTINSHIRYIPFPGTTNTKFNISIFDVMIKRRIRALKRFHYYTDYLKFLCMDKGFIYTSSLFKRREPIDLIAIISKDEKLLSNQYTIKNRAFSSFEFNNKYIIK